MHSFMLISEYVLDNYRKDTFQAVVWATLQFEKKRHISLVQLSSSDLAPP